MSDGLNLSSVAALAHCELLVRELRQKYAEAADRATEDCRQIEAESKDSQRARWDRFYSEYSVLLRQAEYVAAQIDKAETATKLFVPPPVKS